jgi:hypothetical protein
MSDPQKPAQKVAAGHQPSNTRPPRGPRGGGNKRGGRRGGGEGGSNYSRDSAKSNNSGWRSSTARPAFSKNYNNNHNNNNNNNKNYNGNSGNSNYKKNNMSSLTAASARIAALKHVASGDYRSATKVLVEAVKTGVLTESAENSSKKSSNSKSAGGKEFDLVAMLRAMVNRNLYPEISKIVKLVWNTAEKSELRSSVLEAFEPKDLVKQLVKSGNNEEACRCLTEFQLKEDQETTTYVMDQLIKSGKHNNVSKRGRGFIILVFFFLVVIFVVWCFNQFFFGGCCVRFPWCWLLFFRSIRSCHACV